MQSPYLANLATDADSVRLGALLKRVISGELTLPCSAHGLFLNEKLDFGAIDPDILSSEPHHLPAQLLNSSPRPITVTRIDLLPAAEVFAVFSDSSLLHPVALPAEIPAGASFSFTVCLRSSLYPGRLSCRLAVSALCQQESAQLLDQSWSSFVIGCMCTAAVRNPLVDSAADVEAKAFVPAAIRSIFDHNVPSYLTLPPACGASLQRVCCFCRDETSQLANRNVKASLTKSIQAVTAEFQAEEETLIRPCDHVDSQARQTMHCQCSFHLSCIQRWAQVSSEELRVMLPCPACGLRMNQLPNILATLSAKEKKVEDKKKRKDEKQKLVHATTTPNDFRSVSFAPTHCHANSTLMERIAHASPVPEHADVSAEIGRRKNFCGHVAKLIEASKAEFVARADEMRGFTAFDVAFREIKTESPAAVAGTSVSHVQSLSVPSGVEVHRDELQHTRALPLAPPISLLLLTLPGVPENSPKVHLYQLLRLRFSRRGVPEPSSVISGAEFMCHVVKVRGAEVVVACHSAVSTVMLHHFNDNLNLHVFFCADLFGISQDFRLLLYGLHMQHVEPLLFPQLAAAPKFAMGAPATGIFDTRLSAEQLQCVACALQSVTKHDADSSPAHIICGPPGTGKTSVLAEIILQLWQLHQQEPSGAILVTAPSPDAADVLALRLREHLSHEELLLVCSTRRSVDTLRPGLREYANIVTTESYGIPLDVFVLPSIHSLRSRSIIVASCNACAELSDIIADAGKQTELPVSLVIVDEAAQATEVDALKALAFVGKRTRVLLAGDHMQLGPIIASRRAVELQFHVSLMQRLVALDVYRLPGMCSALDVNYRSHPALIAVPSFLFYANSIRCAPHSPCDERDSGRLLSEWPGLPRRDCPLMFYGVAGVDSSPDGHGVCNSVEAKTLLFLASKLLEDMPWLSQSDIGVMAPFRLQVVLLLAFHVEYACSLCAGAARAQTVP